MRWMSDLTGDEDPGGLVLAKEVGCFNVVCLYGFGCNYVSCSCVKM